MRLTVLATAFLLFTPAPAVAQSLVNIVGPVKHGQLDSSIGDYSFLTRSTVGEAIYSACKMNEICELKAVVHGSEIAAIAEAGRIPSEQHNSTNALMARFTCLAGQSEDPQMSDKDRLVGCNVLADLEFEAFQAGFCWDEARQHYALCDG